MDLFSIVAARQGGTGGGTPQKQSDWDESDSNKASYVKNRPFYKEATEVDYTILPQGKADKILDPGTSTSVAVGICVNDFLYPLVLGQEYIVRYETHYEGEVESGEDIGVCVDLKDLYGEGVIGLVVNDAPVILNGVKSVDVDAEGNITVVPSKENSVYLTHVWSHIEGVPEDYLTVKVLGLKGTITQYTKIPKEAIPELPEYKDTIEQTIIVDSPVWENQPTGGDLSLLIPTNIFTQPEAAYYLVSVISASEGTFKLHKVGSGTTNGAMNYLDTTFTLPNLDTGNAGKLESFDVVQITSDKKFRFGFYNLDSQGNRNSLISLDIPKGYNILEIHADTICGREAPGPLDWATGMHIRPENSYGSLFTSITTVGQDLTDDISSRPQGGIRQILSLGTYKWLTIEGVFHAVIDFSSDIVYQFSRLNCPLYTSDEEVTNSVPNGLTGSGLIYRRTSSPTDQFPSGRAPIRNAMTRFVLSFGCALLNGSVIKVRWRR